jgi:hypothetical protein
MWLTHDKLGLFWMTFVILFYCPNGKLNEKIVNPFSLVNDLLGKS